MIEVFSKTEKCKSACAIMVAQADNLARLVLGKGES